VAKANAAEKDHWLQSLAPLGRVGLLQSHRILRDELVARGYANAQGLQARQWKCALKDAIETADRNWKALFVELAPLVFANSNLDDDQKHYCFWMMKDYSRIQRLLQYGYPEPDFKDKDGNVILLGHKRRKQAGNYLNRIIRKHKGKWPRVKKSRSFCLDANMYDVFEEGGVQYLSIMTLCRGKRVPIPLLGRGKIAGNLRIVLDYDRHRIEVHRAVDIKQRWLPQDGVMEALDLGYTEAFVSSRGKAYGKGLGKILTDFSHKLNTTGKARNKLHALEKKYRAEGKTHKARGVRKCTLGLDKKDSVKHRAQASLENKVNSGFNELLEGERPAALVVEDLRHVFTFDNQRDMNRRLSLWAKGIIQDRAELKVQVGGSGLKQVNCAYGSQLCPECGFVWSGNRAGDAFQCLFCGHEGHSDAIAATNYLQRSTDTEIALHTPYRAVKVILMRRFLRRLECAGVLTLPSDLASETVASIMKEWESFVLRSAKTAPERTVPGRTADTESRQQSDVVGDASRSVGGCSRPVNTTSVNRRAKLPLPGSSCS